MIILGNALGAYNLGRVPIQWVANVFAILSAAGVVLITRRLRLIPGGVLLAAIVVWGLAATLVNGLATDFERLSPPGMTTTYVGFVYLRIVTILAFACTAYLVSALIEEGRGRFVLVWTVGLAAAIALASLYIYVAQIYGLPEPPRNRMGTGGAGQAMLFGSGGRPGGFYYHRAMGTFREPTHFGQWLVAPFFLSLGARGVRMHVATALLGLALLLSASMTAIAGAILGLAAALLLTNPLRAQNLRLALAIGQFAALAGIVAYALHALGIAPEGRNDNVLEVLVGRANEVMSGTARDRLYVLDYVAEAPWSLFGYGFGHGNLLFSRAVDGTGSEIVASFLSLYLNAAFSVGVAGLGLLLVWLIRPVVAVATAVRRGAAQGWPPVLVLAAYCAWLVMFAVDTEELTIMFAVTYALLAYMAGPSDRIFTTQPPQSA